MSVARACYINRETVQRSLDIKFTARMFDAVDRAIEQASNSIDGRLHRVFYNQTRTVFYDWPNYQGAYPWRIWFDGSELADVTTTVPVVTSGGNVIPAADIFWGPWNYSPPFTFMELNRSTNASYGQGNTPQRDVAITGNFGYWANANPAGTLTVAMTDTTGTVAQVSNGWQTGVGDVLIVDGEHMLVTDKSFVSTAQTQVSGATTASQADVALTVSGGTFYVNETLLLDSERMLIVDVNGSVLTVKRAWDGTVLATHSGATIYALRSCTVQRGYGGFTAVTHLINATATVQDVPGLVSDLALAIASDQVSQESGGFTTSGETGIQTAHLGLSIADMWDRAETRFGRKHRQRVV